MPTKKKASTTKKAPVVQEPAVSVEIPVAEPGPYHGRHTFHRLEMPTSVQIFTTDIYRCICGATLELTAETRFSRRQPATIKVRMRGE